jgi:histidine ammonia-lyase
MLAQYTQAQLVSELKALAQPASVDSIPTSGTQEDHVSMGWLSGLQLRSMIPHVETVLGIEAMCAAQALDLRKPMEPARGTTEAQTAIRTLIPFLDMDRALAPDIATAAEMVRSAALVDAAQEAVGELR